MKRVLKDYAKTTESKTMSAMSKVFIGLGAGLLLSLGSVSVSMADHNKQKRMNQDNVEVDVHLHLGNGQKARKHGHSHQGKRFVKAKRKALRRFNRIDRNNDGVIGKREWVRHQVSQAPHSGHPNRFQNNRPLRKGEFRHRHHDARVSYHRLPENHLGWYANYRVGPRGDTWGIGLRGY